MNKHYLNNNKNKTLNTIFVQYKEGRNTALCTNPPVNSKEQVTEAPPNVVCYNVCSLFHCSNIAKMIFLIKKW